MMYVSTMTQNSVRYSRIPDAPTMWKCLARHGRVHVDKGYLGGWGMKCDFKLREADDSRPLFDDMSGDTLSKFYPTAGQNTRLYLMRLCAHSEPGCHDSPLILPLDGKICPLTTE